jgi:chaperonin GroES
MYNQNDMSKIKPLSDKIAVLPNEKKGKLSSGIELPGDAKKTTTQTGVVVAAGPGFLLQDGTRVTPSVKPGDTVAFSIHAGAEIEVDGVMYILINEEQIYASLDV